MELQLTLKDAIVVALKVQRPLVERACCQRHRLAPHRHGGDDVGGGVGEECVIKEKEREKKKNFKMSRAFLEVPNPKQLNPTEAASSESENSVRSSQNNLRKSYYFVFLNLLTERLFPLNSFQNFEN